MAAQAVDFTVSGHVNRAIVFTDVQNGSSVTSSEDNGSSGSRVRFTGSSETEAGVDAGVNMEFGVDEASGVGVRHAAVSLGGEFGSLKLGHTSEAAESATYSDKSGVFIGHGQESGASTASDYTPGMSGTRKSGVHFSTASLGPAALHLSATNDDRFSAKITFGGDAGVASYGGALAYLDTGSTYQEIAGSLGIKLASGVTWSMAGGARSDGDDASFVQSTVGYVFGNNSVGVSWYGSSDVQPDPVEGADPANHPHTTMTARPMGDGQILGLGFTHTMPKAGVDVIATVQQYSADLQGGEELDDTVAIIGVRVKF